MITMSQAIKNDSIRIAMPCILTGKIFLLLVLFACVSINGISQSWNAVPNAPVTSRFDDMNFVNDSTGFISQDGVVYKTSDKGDHWNLISHLDSTTNAVYPRSIEFMNDSIGFVGLTSSSVSLIGNVYKTTDGGYSWALLQNMQIQPNDGICGMAHYGSSLVAVGTFYGPAWFYRTNDFGVSWTKVDLSSLASGLVDCYMVNNDTLLVSGVADSANQYRATILKSFDGGLTWQRVYLSPNNVLSYCWKMFFRPNGLGLASVEEGPEIVARTSDFGTTWTTQSVSSSLNSDLGGIGLLNDTLGWVASQFSIAAYETHDGGLTWVSIVPPTVIKKGDRMVVLDSATALICGLSIYKYSLGVTGIQNPSAVNQKKIHELLVYPNPANKMISIDAIAGTNTFGLLDILDEKGSLVQHITRQYFKKGKNSFTVDIKNLTIGNYKLLWRNNELFLTRTFVVVK
jgi:photosystem II stability/assembly factor-like uncharacterized protein